MGGGRGRHTRSTLLVMYVEEPGGQGVRVTWHRIPTHSADNLQGLLRVYLGPSLLYIMPAPHSLPERSVWTHDMSASAKSLVF